MVVVITEDMRAKARIVYGDEICRENSKFVLREVGLPTGLLPLKDIIECGHVEETGFVWLKQKNRIVHKFEKLGRLASYETEISGYLEKYKIKRMSGVKVKELLIWITVAEACVIDPATGNITFKTQAGLYRTFPSSAFESEGDQPDGADPRRVEGTQVRTLNL